MPDALQMLKEDHRKVQDLFKEFEDADRGTEKKRIVTETIKELEIHTQLEEEIFYPAVWKEASPEDKLMLEAEEEHHVVDLLIKELRRMQPSAEQYDAKFKVLSENVKHHIQEEESMMLPKAAELGGERMGELGDEMAVRKAELMRSYGRSTNGRAASRNGRTAAKRTTSTARRPSTNGRRRTATRTTGTRRTSTRTTGTRRTATARRAATGARRTATTRTTRARSAATRSRAGARRRAS